MSDAMARIECAEEKKEGEKGEAVISASVK
jgi:hypothetical protein